VVKFGKLPVRFALAGQWMPVHPEEAGQKWNIEIVMAPVIPKLIKGNLADPSSLRAAAPSFRRYENPLLDAISLASDAHAGGVHRALPSCAWRSSHRSRLFLYQDYSK